MSEFRISPAARTDLQDIWNYYAFELENVKAADRLRDELFARMRKLAQSPGFGHLRLDLSAERLRFSRVRRYLIIYRGKKTVHRNHPHSAQQARYQSYARRPSLVRGEFDQLINPWK